MNFTEQTTVTHKNYATTRQLRMLAITSSHKKNKLNSHIRAMQNKEEMQNHWNEIFVLSSSHRHRQLHCNLNHILQSLPLLARIVRLDYEHRYYSCKHSTMHINLYIISPGWGLICNIPNVRAIRRLISNRIIKWSISLFHWIDAGFKIFFSIAVTTMHHCVNI